MIKRIEFPDFDEAQSPLGNIEFGFDEEDNELVDRKFNCGFIDAEMIMSQQKEDHETNLNIETANENEGGPAGV